AAGTFAGMGQAMAAMSRPAAEYAPDVIAGHSHNERFTVFCGLQAVLRKSKVSAGRISGHLGSKSLSANKLETARDD
ncbi:hypothetical protein, partial [Paracoccus benzoatiresistens]